MTPIHTTEELLKEIHTVIGENDPQKRLPQNTYYLENDRVVCGKRSQGESRYPYDSDGLVVWARSSGIIEACESTFHIFRPMYYAEDASVSFLVGVPRSDGNCDAVSVLGGGRQLNESENLERYVVYGPDCAYYIADHNSFLASVRLHVDDSKHIHFAFSVKNKTETKQRFYAASVIEAILRFRQSEGFWEKLSKFGFNRNGSFLLRSDCDCLVINRENSGVNAVSASATTGKRDVLGSGRLLAEAEAFRNGKFLRERPSTNTSDIPVAAELNWYELLPGESFRQEYDLSYYHDIESADECCGCDVRIDEIDAFLNKKNQREKECFDRMCIQFSDWDNGLCGGVVSRFLRNVQKQVSFCALGKNYAGNFIGMRDVMQQLELSLIWNPQASRAKILTALNNILEDGRAPRQFSLPVGGAMPDMDLRMFIDQGLWVITTVYAYLAFTGDYSILDEKCGYYVVNDLNNRIIRKSERVDTVLEHVLNVMDYLVSNIDEETGCLRILFGDWNDSVDMLGKTSIEGQKYGNGVSVMASLQLYRNCKELCELLEHIGGYDDKIKRYTEVREGLKHGLFKFAVETVGKERRILHGWGEDRGFLVGSSCDPDGEDRISATPHSYWAISGMLENDPSLKSALLSAFARLEGPYGLLTFDKVFPRSVSKIVGRIGNIVPGTYENAGMYVHSNMFASMAMFLMGESDLAWNEIYRSMVISHENCSMTPFVMPNSYCYNPDYGIDGESMGDWYTGSGTVLLKSIVRCGFGINPDLDGLKIQVAKTMPSKSANLKIAVKGHPMEICYNADSSDGQRAYYIDDVRVETKWDELLNTEVLYIPNDALHDDMVIRVEG